MLTQDQIRDLPVVVEFVAVPSTFDIDLFLSMREGAGMFDGKETNLAHLKFVADTIRASPYFILAKVPETTIQSVFLCMEIFRELGLTVDTNYSEAFDSKFRGRSWKAHTEYNYQKGHIGQSAFVIIIVNLYNLVEQNILQPVIEKVVDAEDRMIQLEKDMKMLDEK